MYFLGNAKDNILSRYDGSYFFEIIRAVRGSPVPFFWDDMLEFYLVSFLSDSLRPDFAELYSRLYERPVAVTLAEVFSAPRDLQLVGLKRLAEGLLFSCAVLPGSLTGRRGSIPIEYYETIGSSCYRHLSHLVAVKANGSVFADVYARTGVNFCSISRIIRSAAAVNQTEDDLS